MRLLYDLEFEDLVAFGVHELGDRCQRLYRVTMLVVATVLAVAGLAVSALGGGLGWLLAGLIAAGLLMTLLGPKFGEAVTLAFVRAELAQFDGEAYLGERALEVEDGVLIKRAGDSEYRVGLNALYGVQETNKHTFIYTHPPHEMTYLHPAHVVIVPHARVREGTLGQLVAAIEGDPTTRRS